MEIFIAAILAFVFGVVAGSVGLLAIVTRIINKMEENEMRNL